MSSEWKGLTLWQPWAFAVAHLGKRIENRGRKPPRALVGKRMAIHAGKTVHAESIRVLEAAGHVVPPSLPTGCIVATAVLSGVVEGPEGLRDSEWPWWSGPVGWRLADVVVLERPIPCRGWPGVWSVPKPVAKQLEELRR